MNQHQLDMKKIRLLFCKLKFKFIKKKFKVVYDKDVLTLFTSLKISEKIQRGEIKCTNCNGPITIENFAYLQMKDGNIQLTCNNSDCICQK